MSKEITPQEVEKNLEDFFAKYNLQSQLSVKKIKRWVYESSGESAMEAFNKYQKKFHKFFPEFKNLDEANRILGIFSDAWNYFPHKELGNKSPNDLVKEDVAAHPKKYKNNSKNSKPPKIVCGGMEMEFDEYLEMLKEMEKLQVPFKKWIDGEVLPSYKKYLQKLYKIEKIRKKDYEVAEIFFKRVLQVGFINFIEIRPDFIQKEFPHWWPTHVMDSNLRPAGVLSSLNRLFGFIEFGYYVDRRIFGFK